MRGGGRNRFGDQARWFERFTAAVASEEKSAQVRRGKRLQEKKHVKKGEGGRELATGRRGVGNKSHRGGGDGNLGN